MLGFIRKMFPLALNMDVREGDETEISRPAWSARVDALDAEIARLRREIAAQRSDLEATRGWIRAEVHARRQCIEALRREVGDHTLGGAGDEGDRPDSGSADRVLAAEAEQATSRPVFGSAPYWMRSGRHG